MIFYFRENYTNAPYTIMRIYKYPLYFQFHSIPLSTSKMLYVPHCERYPSKANENSHFLSSLPSFLFPMVSLYVLQTQPPPWPPSTHGSPPSSLPWYPSISFPSLSVSSHLFSSRFSFLPSLSKPTTTRTQHPTPSHTHILPEVSLHFLHELASPVVAPMITHSHLHSLLATPLGTTNPFCFFVHPLTHKP